MIDTIENHLKEACQLSGAAWAAIADCEKGRWFVEAAYRLSQTRRSALEKYLEDGTHSEAVDAVAQSSTPEPISLPAATRLGVGRLYVFSIPGGSETLFVGARSQGDRERRIWRLLASLVGTRQPVDSADVYVPGMQTELAYDLPRAVDRVLAGFLREVEVQGAWLAIRRGDMLDITAQRNDPRLIGVQLTIDSNRLLRRAHRTLAEVIVTEGEPDWQTLPHPVRKSTKQWMCLPLVIGRRLIGAVALWSVEEFSPQKVKQLREIARRVSQPVEVIVTFNELTSHLRRLALLNDFALAVSSAQNLDQIARRVFGYLARSFHTELIAMYLPVLDGRAMREYRNREGRFSTQMTAMSEQMLPLLRGKVLRLNETAPDFKPIYPGARSTLIVPLKYRSQIIGLLSLESTRPEAFSEYDERLMVVIASHLAGLIEYGRLGEEAEARARNLGLIHEVVQQVIGLTDKREVAQITADLLAQFFAYELACVMLRGDRPGESVVGLGGSRKETAQGLFTEEDLVSNQSLAAQVLRTGENAVANVTDAGAMPGMAVTNETHSEMCVALKGGEYILGLIDVQSTRPNAFTNNDLLAMESLAGVLSSVVSSANHYGRLQETIQQLRASQIESQARLRAQQEAENRVVQAAKLVAVGEMAAGIAHELNNPLTTVTGFAELILDETPPESPHRPDIEMVLHEALRARGVVRRLLDFARQGERMRAKCDLNEIIDDVLALSKHFIHTSGVQLDTRFRKDLPWVSLDSNQIKQVFLNLVHNAVQAMPTGGNLRISTESRPRNGHEWAVVVIQDSGIGISERDMDRIFEPFYTTRGTRGGTGLGLSVTYGIVTDHGGTIEVESQPGEGSTFTVWLPY